MKYIIRNNHIVHKMTGSLYNIKDLSSVGYGMPHINNITLNFKDGKSVILTLENENSKKFAESINKRIKKECNCDGFTLLHFGCKCCN